MSEPFYVSLCTVEKVAGVHRKAHLDAGGTVDFGVHGAIKKHFKLDAEPDRPLPVDYLVAAAGA